MIFLAERNMPKTCFYGEFSRFRALESYAEESEKYMLVTLVRTVILYILVLITFRILGKRQVGELQPADLVITLLLSEILVIPMQDTQIPLMNTFIPVLLLIGFEILISFCSIKSLRFRTLLQGNSVIVIRDGKLDQKQLTLLRFTVDDLLEELRKKDVFDISEVQYAIVETDGTLSVLLKPDARVPQAAALGAKEPDNGIPCVVISDGHILESEFKECNMTKQKLLALLQKKHIHLENVLLMTLDRNGNMHLIEKELTK